MLKWQTNVLKTHVANALLPNAILAKDKVREAASPPPSVAPSSLQACASVRHALLVRACLPTSHPSWVKSPWHVQLTRQPPSLRCGTTRLCVAVVMCCPAPQVEGKEFVDKTINYNVAVAAYNLAGRATTATFELEGAPACPGA